MRCKICDAPKSEFHFGGFSCRACAAFFRRYVHSPKRKIVCTCSDRKEVRYPCRKCRMEKCIAAGLTKDKVQACREKNQPDNKDAVPSTSLSTNQIVSRDSPKIFESMRKWETVCYARRMLYGDEPDSLNFYEISCLTRTDAMIIWPMVEDLFPVLRTISKTDKDALLSNFMTKYFVIEAAIQSPFSVPWFKEPTKLLEPSEENVATIVNFYGGAMPEKYRMSNEEVLRIFEPFWIYYYQRIVMPIYEKQYDMIELMAHLLLILLDSAYSNISEYCSKHCAALRSMILRELRAYQREKNHPNSRFIEVMENIILIERADEKFQEEIQICELYNYPILSRDSRKLHETVRIWKHAYYDRTLLYGNDSENLNIYEITCFASTDAMIIWPMVEDLFPVLKTRTKTDKDALLSSFMSKSFMIESAIKNSFNIPWFTAPAKFFDVGNKSIVENFYGAAIPKQHKLSSEDVLRIIEPFYMYFNMTVVKTIYEKRYDTYEAVAQYLLILVDSGYSNISEYCSQHCCALRTMILREIRAYQREQNRPESKFIDIMKNMILNDKADAKFQEKIQICELYNVKLHEDFKRLFRTNN